VSGALFRCSDWATTRRLPITGHQKRGCGTAVEVAIDGRWRQLQPGIGPVPDATRSALKRLLTSPTRSATTGRRRVGVPPTNQRPPALYPQLAGRIGRSPRRLVRSAKERGQQTQGEQWLKDCWRPRRQRFPARWKTRPPEWCRGHYVALRSAPLQSTATLVGTEPPAVDVAATVRKL